MRFDSVFVDDPVLASANLERTERPGQSIVYSLNASIVEEITSAALSIFAASRHSRRSKLTEEPR